MFRNTFEGDIAHEGDARRHRDAARHPGMRHHHRGPGRRRGAGPDGMPIDVRGMLGRGGWGRGRLRRGEIRPLILATLLRRPMHGYEIIQELEAQSGGRWRPSAGSVYPTLQQLADEGFVTSDDVDGRRTYTLTEEGLAAADANPASDRWTDRTAGDEPELRTVGLQLIGAVMQVQRVGSSRARSETNRILADARRRVYGLLADDEGGPAADDGAAVDAASADDAPSTGGTPDNAN